MIAKNIITPIYRKKYTPALSPYETCSGESTLNMNSILPFNIVSAILLSLTTHLLPISHKVYCLRKKELSMFEFQQCNRKKNFMDKCLCLLGDAMVWKLYNLASKLLIKFNYRIKRLKDCILPTVQTKLVKDLDSIF